MIWSAIAGAAGSFFAKIGIKFMEMWALVSLGKEKIKRKQAEKDVEELKKDAEIDASPDLCGDALYDKLRGKK